MVAKGVEDFVATSRDSPLSDENADQTAVPAAAEVAQQQSYTLPPKEPKEQSRTCLLSQLESSLAPPPPVDTITSLHNNVHLSPPRSGMESFASNHSGRSAASAYSAATNFTFGQKCSPMPMPSQLLTLQEDKPLAEIGDEEVCEDMPEYSMAASYAVDASGELHEDSVAKMGRAVEQSVHAFVDAGESAWSHIQRAWTSRYGMLTPITEEVGADSDAMSSEVKTARQGSWRPLRGLDWSCASA